MRSVPALARRRLQRSIPSATAQFCVARSAWSDRRAFSTSKCLRNDDRDDSAAALATAAALEKLKNSIHGIKSRAPPRTATRAAEVDRMQLTDENYDDVFFRLSSLYNDSMEKYSDVYKAHRTFKEAYPNLKRFDIMPDPQTGVRVEDLDESHVKQRITVHGFIKTVRLHNRLLAFAELSDGGKVLQLIHCTSKYPEIYESLKSLAFQASVRATGVLKWKKLQQPVSEGSLFFYEKVELQLEEFEVYNSPSVYIMPDSNFPPRQRHLQIRTDPKLLESLKLRSRMSSMCRTILESRGFMEVETPLLFKSTPEGAREFLVVTRNKGHMYALPQSPQQYKQILMASGVRKYYQLAKCFRDEDLRADRQPEFTQLDMEMSFVNGEAVMYETENLLKQLLWNTIGLLIRRIPQITYHEAIAKYGSDKPDLRFGFKIQQVTKFMAPTDDYVYEILSVPGLDLSRLQFKKVYEATFGGDVIPNNYTTDANSPDLILAMQTSPGDKLDEHFLTRLMPNIGVLRSEIDGRVKKEMAAKGGPRDAPLEFDDRRLLKWTKKTNDDILSDLAKYINLQTGDIVAIGKRKNMFSPGGGTRMGELRKRLHAALVEQGHIPQPQGYRFAWITEFPLFTPRDETEAAPSSPSTVTEDSATSAPPPTSSTLNDLETTATPQLLSTHHPFTSPLPHHLDLLKTNPSRVLAQHYDLVCNGVEVGGGSTRIHNPDLQKYVLSEVLKLPPERLKTFDHLIEVLESGAPPHAGIALGFDRLVSMISGAESIRDVIAFPKNSRGVDPVVESPGVVTEEMLRVYGLRYVEGSNGGAEEVEVVEEMEE